MNDSRGAEEIRLILQTESNEQFECMVSPDMSIIDVVAQLYDEQGWPRADSSGRGVRAVVDLVDPDNPVNTKRINSDQTVDKASLYDGAILRVSSESLAAAVDQRERMRALIADHREMEDLAEWDPRISFKANTSHAPTRYEITFDLDSFKCLSPDGHTPVISKRHQVEIVLPSDYPREAPRVRWLTPIFHPNIHPKTGDVCIGVIRDRYMPGLGLARLTIMLAEMAEYRNFNPYDSLDREAAEWARDPEHFPFIERIGGAPFQGPVRELFDKLEKIWGESRKRPKVKFKRLRRQGIYDD